jgi:DNA-binding MarR family transcriptional regulator
MIAGYMMSTRAAGTQIEGELVEAFTSLGPAWDRWINVCLPEDTVSYSRIRLLAALTTSGPQTMGQLASALSVTPRRITALVDVLENDGLLARTAHPTDARSTIVEIAESGMRQQELCWKRHQAEVGLVFGDLDDHQQLQLLEIARGLTEAINERLAGGSGHADAPCD